MTAVYIYMKLVCGGKLIRLPISSSVKFTSAMNNPLVMKFDKISYLHSTERNFEAGSSAVPIGKL